MHELGIFILCYNRPEYIQDAINSILAQSFTKFDLIISDNSTNDSVQKVLETYRHIPNITITRRKNSCSPIEHLHR